MKFLQEKKWGWSFFSKQKNSTVPYIILYLTQQPRRARGNGIINLNGSEAIPKSLLIFQILFSA